MGWMLTGLLVVLALYAGRKVPYRFLAVSRPVESSLIAVEGWVFDQTLINARELLLADTVSHILTTGGPIPWGAELLPEHTWAELTRERLIQLGVSPEKITALPTDWLDKGRTSGAAGELKKWLYEHAPKQKRINILTQGAHARRTRYTFRRKLGRDFGVGIYSFSSSLFDENNWYRRSAGVKTVFYELTAYCYTLLTE